jgi:hypothetical protein
VDKRKRETLDETISNTNRRGNPVTGKIGIPDSLEIAWTNT